jgi:hypothetical protein
MIKPTLRVQRLNYGGSDIYGQPILLAPTYEMVAPVRLQFDIQHTTVRTDSAATHGHAMEETANVILLALPKSSIKPNDVLIVLENKVKVIRMIKRHRVSGALDHVEIHCTAWK